MKIEYIILFVSLLLGGLLLEQYRYQRELNDLTNSGDETKTHLDNHHDFTKLPENQLKREYLKTCCFDHGDEYGVICFLDHDCYMPLRNWLDKGMLELFPESEQFALKGRVYRYVRYSTIQNKE